MLKLIAIILYLTPGGSMESGRAIMAYTDGYSVSCTFDKNTATVKGSGYKVVVLPTEISVDKVRIPIDESVKKVSVHFRGGVASFVADGETVAYYERD